jgi:anti-sigma B factor antagonist
MLKIHVKKLDRVAVLCLEGQIVIGDTEILRGAVRSASDSSDVILNLSEVTTLDAHGLGVLLQLREETLAKGIQFELRNASKRLYRVFELARLNTVFQISTAVQFLPDITYSQCVPVAA